ncbi:unnamed protein product [Symbiodinium microadriaticum]|nr:unnamed protein product [Symbiodinium microadriaticum]
MVTLADEPSEEEGAAAVLMQGEPPRRPVQDFSSCGWSRTLMSQLQCLRLHGMGWEDSFVRVIRNEFERHLRPEELAEADVDWANRGEEVTTSRETYGEKLQTGTCPAFMHVGAGRPISIQERSVLAPSREDQIVAVLRAVTVQQQVWIPLGLVSLSRLTLHRGQKALGHEGVAIKAQSGGTQPFTEKHKPPTLNMETFGAWRGHCER